MKAPPPQPWDWQGFNGEGDRWEDRLCGGDGEIKREEQWEPDMWASWLMSAAHMDGFSVVTRQGQVHSRTLERWQGVCGAWAGGEAGGREKVTAMLRHLPSKPLG